jgi:hypothetical protein
MVAVKPSSTSNRTIASMLAEVAAILQQQEASEYRVQAYERAAQTVRDFPEPIEAIYRRDHLQGLIAIPTIGRSIAGAIQEYLLTHHMSMLERLRGQHVRQTHRNPRTIQLRLWQEQRQQDLVPISELLGIDQQYRQSKSDRNRAEEQPQPPVMSIQRGDRHYTVHFSNTPRAQQYHATDDWVVIERDDQPQHTQWTVMTSHDGKLHGCRTVRGRDEECYKYYRTAAREAVEKYPMLWS